MSRAVYGPQPPTAFLTAILTASGIKSPGIAKGWLPSNQRRIYHFTREHATRIARQSFRLSLGDGRATERGPRHRAVLAARAELAISDRRIAASDETDVLGWVHSDRRKIALRHARQ